MKIIAQTNQLVMPLPAASGFSTPVDTEAESALDLNQHVIQHPAATYYIRAQGDAMMQLGIFDADLLVVDRTLEPAHGDVVIAKLNGEWVCKVLDLHFYQLLSGNDLFPSIKLSEVGSFTIDGVVTHSLRYHQNIPVSRASRSNCLFRESENCI